jgi:flagella basal body P-ring formation protein FlgA
MMRALILGLTLAFSALPALAGQTVTLKAAPWSADGVVTLGDIFDGAGPAARVAVGQRTGSLVILDAAAVQGAARRAGLDWANTDGLRRIVIKGGDLAPTGQATSAAAQAGAESPRGNVEILTYAHSLSTGEILQPEDLVWAKAAAAPADSPRDADQIIGKAARRPLREGAPVSQRDVSAPQVIKTGDTVTVTYSGGGISLAMEGKALSAAAIGDTLMVLNTSSKKTLQATASGPGQALIGPEADQMRGASRSQIALR